MSHSLHLPLSTCLVQLNCGGSLCPPVPQHMHRYLLLSALKFSCCSQQYCSHFCLHALQLSSEQSLLCTLWEVCSMLPCANQPASMAGRLLADVCLVFSFVLIAHFPPLRVFDLRWRGNTNWGLRNSVHERILHQVFLHNNYFYLSPSNTCTWLQFLQQLPNLAAAYGW